MESFAQLPFPIFEDQKTSSATQIESGNLLVQRNMMKHPRKIPVQRSSTIIKFIRHSTENYPKSSKILFNIICPYIKIFQETTGFFLGSQRRFLKCVAGSWAPHPKGAIASGSPALSAVPREVRPGQALPSWVKPHSRWKHHGCLVRWYLWSGWWSQRLPNLTSTNFGWFFFIPRCEKAHWAETGTNEILF